jgi:hypothetical protein
MTEHGKSQPRVYDELSSSHEIVHQGRQDAIAAGITVVNVAPRFISPLRQRAVNSPPTSKKSQTIDVGQSRYITDDPGIENVLPRARLENQAIHMIFAAGKYNKSTKTVSKQVAHYEVLISFGKGGAIDNGKDAQGRPKTRALRLTRDEFIALAKVYGISLPKDKKTKKECPECVLRPN